MPNIPGAEPGPSGIRDYMELIALIEAYFAEDGLDAEERAVVEDVRTKFAKLAARRQGEQEKALGMTPQIKSLTRPGLGGF